VRQEHRTTIPPCSTSWSVTKPPSPLHPLPLQLVPLAVRGPVIPTVIQDAVSKPASQHFPNIPLTRMIWDMLDIPRVTLALPRAALHPVPLSASQVSCHFKSSIKCIVYNSSTLPNITKLFYWLPRKKTQAKHIWNYRYYVFSPKYPSNFISFSLKVRLRCWLENLNFPVCTKLFSSQLEV